MNNFVMTYNEYIAPAHATAYATVDIVLVKRFRRALRSPKELKFSGTPWNQPEGQFVRGH